MEPVYLALRVVLSLAVVLGLLWLVQRRLNRKARARNSADLVTVVTRQGIAQKASVVVVDVEGTRYLLGVTEQSVNVLGTSEAPIVAAGAESFAESLDAAALDKGELALITGAVRRPKLVTDRKPAAKTPASAAGRPAANAAWKPSGKLGGSVLSADIWKQAVTVLKQGLGR